MNERGSERGKVSWNIASKQSEYIFELIKKSMNFYQIGNLAQWYWTLSSLREMINYSLKEDQRDKLDKMEKASQVSLKYWAKYRKQIEGYTEIKLNKTDLYKKNLLAVNIRMYQRELMDLLNSLGYFPSKKDRTEVNF